MFKSKTGTLGIIVVLLQVPTWARVSPNPLLGLPVTPLPIDNPMSPEKIQLGEKIFNDKRFSSTGEVSCASCHDPRKAFGDQLRVAEGVQQLRGTRNSPTILNSAYSLTQFWDGRSPSLEEQALHPFVNPVEMGLANHEPILETIRGDANYRKDFQKVFGFEADRVQMKQVTMAIAAFERTLVDGNSRFDRWRFNQENTLTEEEIRGFNVFTNQGRCSSCHLIEATTAVFTDQKFSNIGVGINKVNLDDLQRISEEFLRANYNHEEVDKKVLSDPLTSELGRFVVTRSLSDIGGFKTPTLRNIALTAPYMHDGSMNTLEEVVEHYNRGGASSDSETINPFLSGGIRPLKLTLQEKSDLVAFMKALTSAKHETHRTRRFK
jgi:cytochrome c peroxidase